MKKIIIVFALVLNLFASDDYIPLSNLSQEQKEEYNFVNKNIIVETKEDNTNYAKKEEVKQKEEVLKPINKELVKEYKKENILKDEKKLSSNVFDKEFFVSPKISYMQVYTTLEKEEVEKTDEIVPEILFTYKNHNLKFDYFGVDVEKSYLQKSDFTDFNSNMKWYRLAYLYSFYNANIGMAYNQLKMSGKPFWDNAKSEFFQTDVNQKFPTIEAHLKNQQNQLVVQYGGFYGKNNEIKDAYEYYLTLGYKIFNNDNLIFNAGYKNRTFLDEDMEITFKGPIIGISSTF